MNPQWIGIAVSVAVVLGGTAVNLFIIGRFVGQWSEAMKNIVATLSKVETRLEEVDDRAEVTESKRTLMEARLGHVEGGVDRFWEMRDEFVTMRVTVEQQGKHSSEKLDSLARSYGVIERQLANLVSTRSGFTTLNSENKN